MSRGYRTAARTVLGIAPILLPLLLISMPEAWGAEAAFTPDCGPQNLLARKSPIEMQAVRGNASLVTDEHVAPEGAQWDSPVAIVFDLGSGVLTYDLGQPTPVSSFYVQADGNDTYKIFGSLDGTPKSYSLIVELDTVEGHGLRGRAVTVKPTMVRYLRVGEGVGDSFYSMSEFAAYCRAPDPFPPRMAIVNAPPARVPEPPLFQWNNEVSARFEMVLAFAGAALIMWGIWLRRQGLAAHMRRWRNIALLVLGLLGAGAYWNFGSFHFGNYIHIWEMFHYYMGAKYFPEVSYDRLYDCASVADAEDPSLRRRVELRKIMNLRTNMMGPTTDVLANPDTACKQHFTPQRWEDFKRDIKYFRIKHGTKRWEDVFSDHGYNATPVWTILGTTIANLGPVSDNQLFAISLLDWGAALGMLAMIYWAFGWRTLCVAAAVFGTNFPSRFYWTGGSFLRWDWLFYLVGGVCLLRRKWWALGGAFLSYSALLRVFPVFAFVGPFFVLVQGYIRTRKLDRRYLSMFAGALLAGAVLIPVSLVKSGGVDGYRAFVRNTVKHAETPLTNYMGLRTVVAYKVSEAGRFLRSDKADDAWGEWKRAKVRTFHHRLPIFGVLAIGFAVLLWFAVKGQNPWVACALSITMIAVGAELTSYYYSFIVAVTLLYRKRRQVGAIMLAVTGATSFIDWAPTRFLPDTRPWIFFKMPTWLDEQYMWMGLVTMVGFAWILYDFCFPAGHAVAATRKAFGLDPPKDATKPATPVAAAADAAPPAASAPASASASASVEPVPSPGPAVPAGATIAASRDDDEDDDEEDGESADDDGGEDERGQAVAPAVAAKASPSKPAATTSPTSRRPAGRKDRRRRR